MLWSNGEDEDDLTEGQGLLDGYRFFHGLGLSVFSMIGTSLLPGLWSKFSSFFGFLIGWAERMICDRIYGALSSIGLRLKLYMWSRTGVVATQIDNYLFDLFVSDPSCEVQKVDVLCVLVR
ncbi:BnaA08g06770D [Brassica napus]|uniref:(rape) hypothetical protein n=1 Tax=Brassica napus TaxID=3708 RepID=A0A078I6B9_BRANA|nr:unnamed protein product [Brassica napus]CDY44663.1 BnaA08g06770D [Brassica napus]